MPSISAQFALLTLLHEVSWVYIHYFAFLNNKALANINNKNTVIANYSSSQSIKILEVMND